MPDGIREPFGLFDCESEVEILKSHYRELYFYETPFNDAAVNPEAYLIVGRRGSGKTALAQSFSFQKHFERPICILVDQPDVYLRVLSEVANLVAETRQIAIPRLRRVWEYVLWRLILEQTGASAEFSEVQPTTLGLVGRVSHLLNGIIDGVLHLLAAGNHDIDARIEHLLSTEDINVAKQRIRRLAHKRPIILTLDTLEQYDMHDHRLMLAIAALIEYAEYFNRHYSDSGIHLKIFMSGEIFPYLAEAVVLNPLKSIRKPVYLLWRPKDLLRLISWRFHRYLESKEILPEHSQEELDWTNSHKVFEKMWIPYFGEFISNHRGIKEHTFPYVLRHTQMRPRQLIALCNSIAAYGKKAGHFPRFSEVDIREGVRASESRLASEIINSYESIYPQVDQIVNALRGIDKVFEGRELARRAHKSARAWPAGTYSPLDFLRLVTELGIVGTVRRNNEAGGFIDADFEYSLEDRLHISEDDLCVIHPMFYTRLAVKMNSDSRVMPFSTERESVRTDESFSF